MDIIDRSLGLIKEQGLYKIDSEEKRPQVVAYMLLRTTTMTCEAIAHYSGYQLEDVKKLQDRIKEKAQLQNKIQLMLEHFRQGQASEQERSVHSQRRRALLEYYQNMLPRMLATGFTADEIASAFKTRQEEIAMLIDGCSISQVLAEHMALDPREWVQDWER